MDGNAEESQTLVVVGNGITGFHLCRRLVECGATPGPLRLLVFGEEPRPAYDRVRLTELLSGRPEDDLRLVPEAWYRDHGIDLRLGDPVVCIDRTECVVRSASGTTAPFDRLVLATGSRPFVPPIPGADHDGVFVYRTVDDLRAIMERARGAARAVVIGGGLLGLEAAHAMQGLGLEVHVVEAGRWLLPRQLDEAGARVLAGQLEALGLRVHTGRRTMRIQAEGSARTVCLDGGEHIAADLVVLAAGIRPRGELGREAGLEMAVGGGVIVDDHLQSSDPRIFAVGECAAHRGVTYGLAAPGIRMIDVLVDNLFGGDAVFEGAERSARLTLSGRQASRGEPVGRQASRGEPVSGVAVAALGRYEESADTQAHTYLAGGVYRKLLLREGRIVGALAVGDWADLARVQDAIHEPVRFSLWDLRRFRSTGSLWERAASPPVHEWPADALVCGCMGIRLGALTEAEQEGCETAAELSARTGAGTACGSCRPLLVELVHRARMDSVPSSHLEAWVAARRAPEADPSPAESPPTLRCSALPAPPPPAPPEMEPPSPPVRTLVSLYARDSSTPPSADLLPLEDVARRSVRSSSRLPEHDPGVGAGRTSTLVVAQLVPSPTKSGAGHDAVAPSSRRESMAPLRPISVPPSRISRISPGRIAPTLPPPTPAADRTRAALLASAAAVLGISALLLLLPPLPASRSFQGFHADVLWTEPAWQKASGYAALVLTLAGLSLSVRKRSWRRPQGGGLAGHSDVAGMRVLHSVLGVAALLCLVCHTGLRVGERFNRLLSIDFIAASVLGAVAAAATALGDPAAGAARRILATRAHLFILLPLPVLVALHVLGAYYF
jgi:nitrite reductase (NADH) large subunit